MLQVGELHRRASKREIWAARHEGANYEALEGDCLTALTVCMRTHCLLCLLILLVAVVNCLCHLHPLAFLLYSTQHPQDTSDKQARITSTQLASQAHLHQAEYTPACASAGLRGREIESTSNSTHPSMVNQAARNKKKKAKKQAAARQDTGSTTEAEQDAYLAAAHAQAQLERERLALEHQRRAALVEAAAAAEFQGRQLQHGSYHVAPDGTVYDEHGELMEDEDDEEEDDEEDEDDLDDEDLEDEEDDDEDDEDEDDDDLLDEDEELRIEVDHQVLQEHQRYIRQQQQAQSQQQQQSRSRQPSSTTAAAATHEALLGTANDLYKQIENAAAAALSGAHAGQQRGGNAGVNAASFSTSLFPAATGGEEDDAYWLSLPSHLRSFIRSALPLAAGLSTSPQSQQQQQQGGNNGLPTAQQINLTPDQMAAAAAQLAQVVQNGWASTLAKEPLDSPLRSALLNAQQQQANAQGGQRGSGNSTTTTIPLGAFALPLHPHPDSPEAAAAFQAAAQAAAQAAVGGGNNNGSNGGNQASTLPFPSLANLQASLLQLAKMPPGDLASHPGFPGNPFTAPMSNNTEGVPSPQMPQQAAGESKSSKKKKKKQASQAAAAAAAASIPTPQQQQPPMPAQPMQPIPERVSNKDHACLTSLC